MPRSEPYERLGAKRLSLPDVVAQSVGFMGPVFFALFAWGSTFGGFALVVVYLLMCIGSLRSFATSSSRGKLAVGYVSTFVLSSRQQASTRLADLSAGGDR